MDWSEKPNSSFLIQFTKQMNHPSVIALFCTLLLLFTESVAAEDKLPVEVPIVELIAVDGTSKVLIAKEPEHKLTVLCFLGTECPLAKLYAGRLQAFSQQFKEVRFVGVSSNVQDSLKEVNTYIEDQKITFEFAKDYENRFADQLKLRGLQKLSFSTPIVRSFTEVELTTNTCRAFRGLLPNDTI